MATPLNESLLRALVGEARRDESGARVLAISAPPNWAGKLQLDTEWGHVRIAPCVSALAVREALAGHTPPSDELVVILTDRSEDEIGQEVLARVWRNRLQRPSGWEAVRQLFRVERLDPALADARWLVDLLVDVAPPRGYAPPPSGFLDVDTAWRTALRYGLRISVDRPSIFDLLEWGVTERARSAFNGPAGKYRDRIAERLAFDAGPVARHVLRLVGEGRGADIVPFGLVCEVLWSASDPSAQTARIRFETPLGTKDLSGVLANAWAQAALKIYLEFLARLEFVETGAWAKRAQSLLMELGAADLALNSSVLPDGFIQRLSHAGTALQHALGSTTDELLDGLTHAVEMVERHARADAELDEDRVRRLRMAFRLTKWLRIATKRSVPDLAAAANEFVCDGAWVDAAREAIGHGESVPSLADAYGQLTVAVDARRRERDLQFGRLFAEWSKVVPTDSSRLMPIESLLGEVVGPIAKQAPVLLLVLDGLSHPESLRIQDDLMSAGWISHGPNNGQLPIVLAALPTVTVISRASLLTGSLAKGSQDVERAGFTGHPVLRTLGPKAPRLFHKKDLKIEQGRIAPEVHEVILDTGCAVVGVVVNGVDDHLAKGAQLRLADGLRGIRPVRYLLDVAAEAGRVVILASDHGHVNENGSKVRPRPGAGERWRPNDDRAEDDEVVIAGPRVLKGNGSIIAPAVETIRYIPMEKKGYHGGATPQEVLCPMLVMTTGKTELKGWTPLPKREPVWWTKSAPAVSVEPSPPIPRETVDARGQVELGLLVETKSERQTNAMDEWVNGVLTSPVMESQRETAGRQALDETSLRGFLTTLYSGGGLASPAVLADTLRLPPSRVRTKVEALRRMLNVDGYAVLTIESGGTVRLNIELLQTQFEVSE